MAHTGRAHEDAAQASGRRLVPRSTQAAALLNELRTITGTNPHGLLLPGLLAGKPISDATLGQVLRRLGYGPERIVPHQFRAAALLLE